MEQDAEIKAAKNVYVEKTDSVHDGIGAEQVLFIKHVQKHFIVMIMIMHALQATQKNVYHVAEEK